MTQHGSERVRERVGLNVRAATRVAHRAIEKGAAPAAFVGSFRRYLDGLSLRGDCRPRVYGEHVYIFGIDDALITVYLVPTKFRALLRRLRQRES